MVKEITVDSFNTEVINSDKLTVVDFYAIIQIGRNRDAEKKRN